MGQQFQGNWVAPTMAESEAAISTLVSMGFDRSSAIRALAQARNDIHAAAELLLNSHSQ